MRDVTFWPSAEQRSRLATRLSAPRRRLAAERQSRLDVGADATSRRRRRSHDDGRNLRAVRDDARQRRRAERRADLEPALRRAHGLGVHSVDVAGPAGRRRLWARRARRDGRGGPRHVAVATARSAGAARTARTSGSIRRRTSSASCSRRRRIERSRRTSRTRSCRRSSSNERRLQSLAPSSASSDSAR